MAKIEPLIPFILQWEGGYVDNPNDLGGCTNMGVTIETWKELGYDKDSDGIITCADIKLLDENDFKVILKQYWDRWLADNINNQSIANILVDWVWGSGKWGIIIPQRILKVEQDGIVGNQTISALNDFQNQEQLFDLIKDSRVLFVQDIVDNDPSQTIFLQGWKNRINSYTYST